MSASFGVTELLILMGVVFLLAVVPITVIALMVFAVTKATKNNKKSDA